MANEEITPYTETQYRNLTPEQQEVLQQVATHLTAERMTTTDDEMLQSTFNILRPCDGCLPEEEIGEDLLADIRRKFSCVYYTAIERAEKPIEDERAAFIR